MLQVRAQFHVKSSLPRHQSRGLERSRQLLSASWLQDLPDASGTPPRRLWGGSWGCFWLILAHLAGVLGAQDGPIFCQDPKMPLRCPLTFQDAPKARPRRAQDSPRLPKTFERRSRDLSKARFLRAWEPPNKNSCGFPKHLSIQASKHRSGDGGMRGAFE